MKSRRKTKSTPSNNVGDNRDIITQATGEINRIFGAIVKKKITNSISSGKKGQKSKVGKKRKKVFEEVTDKALIMKNNNVKPIRYLNDGLPVYRLEDINLGNGGGTPDCPFDCTCCF